jgi:multiple sugar transport system permease protein
MKSLHMKKSHNTLQGYLLIAPLLLGCLLFYAIPFILVIQYSLSTGSGGSSDFIGFINYQDVASNRMFQLAFGNTMRFLAAALPLIMVLAYLIAILMQKHANKHKLLKSVFLFPYIMPVVGAVILVELLFADSGLVPSITNALGLPLVDWLGGPAAFGVVLLLYLWKNTGYSVILLLAGLVTIPEEQYSAADLDGASDWQKFFYITTPQMWYSVFFAIIFSLINAFKCFREIFLIGGTHPNENIYMLQHFLNNSFENLNYAKLSVASVLLLVVVLVVFAVFYGFVRRKEAFRA